MFTFYKVLADPHGGQVTFLKDDETTTIKDDKRKLEEHLKHVNFLVCYDNYRYDDKLVSSILRGLDPYKTLEKITDDKRFSLVLQKPITLYLKQELWSVELDEVKYNLN